MKLHLNRRGKAGRPRQDGYVLIVMLLFLTLMAIGLTAVAPAIAQRVRREREIELIHRGKQYARAIRLFYRKFGRYPMRLEELEKTNNIRFLRKRYKDPMTAGGEWRLIHFGEAQITLPNAAPVLPGAATPGSSSGLGGASSPFANTFSASPQPGLGQASATPGQAGATQAQSDTTAGQSGTTAGASADSSQSGQAGGQSGQPGTPASQLSSSLGKGPTFGGGPVVGVASTSKKQSIKELDKKNHYNDWEFVYDPRLEVTAVQPLAGAANQPNQIAPGIQISPGVQSGPTSPGMPGMQPTKQ